MKTHTTISIDLDLLMKAKTLKINVSEMTNKVLKGLVSQYTDQDIDMFEIEKEMDILDNKATVIHARKQELLAQKVAFEEKREQTNKKELKEQLKMAEMVKRSL